VLGPSPASGCLRALLDRHVAADDDRTPRPHAAARLAALPRTRPRDSGSQDPRGSRLTRSGTSRASAVDPDRPVRRAPAPDAQNLRRQTRRTTDGPKRACADVHLTGLAAGFHAVAQLGPGASETATVEAAGTRGVRIYGMSANRSTRAPDPPHLVLGFGNLSQRAIIEGITQVAPLLQATFT
jgi:hypothetical protein